VVRYSAERFFKALLYANAEVLTLPAIVRSTVVLDAKRNAHVERPG
jgi:hypothetical protein